MNLVNILFSDIANTVPHQRSNTKDVKREGFEEDDGTFSNVEIKKEPDSSDNFYLQTSSYAPAPSKSNTSVQSYHHSEDISYTDPPTHELTTEKRMCKLAKIGGGIRRRCFYHPRVKDKKTPWQCEKCNVTCCPECFFVHQDNLKNK